MRSTEAERQKGQKVTELFTIMAKEEMAKVNELPKCAQPRLAIRTGNIQVAGGSYHIV